MSTFCVALCIFVIGELIAKTLNLMYTLYVQVTAYGRQTVPDRGVVSQVMWPIKILWAPVCHWNGAPEVVIFYSSNRMTYYPQKGRYDHVTV